jgi:hypothetical protein
MSPASDPLLFIGSPIHSCVFPPSVLSNGDNKGDSRRIYLNKDIAYVKSYCQIPSATDTRAELVLTYMTQLELYSFMFEMN